MKRSRLINLMILGTGLVSMTACDDKKNKPLEFRDEQECRKTHTPEECQKALHESQAKHLAAAPKFTSKEECEKQFGPDKCMATPQSGEHRHGMFMPMMMGFMMGRMMGSSATPILPTAPASSAGRASSSARGFGAQAPSTANVQRGGFGSAAPHFSAGS